MAKIVHAGPPQDGAPAATPRARVLPPLVECAHPADLDDEMTPERVAEALQSDEAASTLPSV